MAIPNIKNLEIAQYRLENPLCEKYDYYKYMSDNPFSVNNSHKREAAALKMRWARKLKSMSKQELIEELKIWDGHYATHNMSPLERWPVVLMIKKALKSIKK